jgi:PKD repeat protein
VVSWSWDFGDGSTDTGAIVTHSYAETNNYTVTLTTEDTHGVEGTEIKTVAVSAAGKSLLVIVSNPNSPVANDQNLIAWLEGKGYTLTLIDDGATEAEILAAASANDGALVSYSVVGTALLQKANAVSVGMMVLEPVAIADGATNGMGFAEDGATKSKNTIVITDNTHYITSSFSGNVQIFNSSPVTTCGRYLAPGANSLATAEDLPDWSAVFYLETGAELLTGFGTAPARRAAGLLGGNINNMTEEGKVLLLRAIEWVCQ